MVLVELGSEVKAVKERVASLPVLIFVALLLFAGCGDRCTSPTEGYPIAVIETNMGNIVIDLYEDKTPNTVGNFIRLANDGFYDGLLFHRVVRGFVIQGGVIQVDGTHRESPYGPIDLELHPDATHVDGAVAMAWTGNPNNATSQFYICDGAQHHLDGQFAVFGIVICGTDVVGKIASVATTTENGYRNWPIDDVVIQTISITHCVQCSGAAAR